jgi:phosphoadenosine phosphosulfate reductase
MALIENTMFGRIDKVQTAIERIRRYDPALDGGEPYYIAYSGGKDSDVVRILMALSGVRHELWHSHTTADAPETVNYVRGIPGIQINRPERTMWQLIVDKQTPPTRIIRYCCEHLKECGGAGRTVVTGVRWAESDSRKRKRGSLELGRNLILNADNDERRRVFDMRLDKQCGKKDKFVLNPIVDWSVGEVWEFLNHYACTSNPLYAEGFTRVGCIGCPMAGWRGQRREFARWPRYQTLYVSAFDRMIDARRAAGKAHGSWSSGEAVFAWWTSPKPTAADKNQITLWEA